MKILMFLPFLRAKKSYQTPIHTQVVQNNEMSFPVSGKTFLKKKNIPEDGQEKFQPSKEENKKPSREVSSNKPKNEVLSFENCQEKPKNAQLSLPFQP